MVFSRVIQWWGLGVRVLCWSLLRIEVGTHRGKREGNVRGYVDVMDVVVVAAVVVVVVAVVVALVVVDVMVVAVEEVEVEVVAVVVVVVAGVVVVVVGVLVLEVAWRAQLQRFVGIRTSCARFLSRRRILCRRNVRWQSVGLSSCCRTLVETFVA